MSIPFSVLEEALKGKSVVVVGNSTKVVENEEDHNEVCNNADFVIRLQEGIVNYKLIPYTGTRCDIYISRKVLWSLQDNAFEQPKYAVWASPNSDFIPEDAIHLPEEHIYILVDQLGSFPTMGVRAVYMALQCGAKVTTVGFGFYSPECKEQPATQHKGDNERIWCENNGVDIQ